MVKKFIVLIAVLVSGFSYSQGSWEEIITPTTKTLNSVYFTDSLYGWAVGDTGIIIHTIDGGENWFVQDSKTENSIRGVFFLDRDNGYAISWNFSGNFFGTLIHRTLNGGTDWTSYEYPEQNLFMNCILFQDNNTGWMGGSPHALVKTTDGGGSWNQANIDTNALAFFPVLNIKFYNEQYGYASGGMFDIAGVTWSTSDGGANWIPIKPEDAPADEVHGLHIFDSITVMGSGGDPDQGYGVAMIRSDDGGQNWDYEELSMQGNAFDLDFRTENDAWAPLGYQQKLIYSQDAGNTWNEYACPDASEIYDIIFPDSLHGFGVGKDGAVIRYKPVIIGVEELNQDVEVDFKIFPNPFSVSTSIGFSLPENADNDSYIVKLLVYNNAGKLIKTIVDNELIPGKYYLKFYAGQLKTGLYYCKMQVVIKDRIIDLTRKIIIRQD